jgi:uncharacterized protein (UPF0332 family)
MNRKNEAIKLQIERAKELLSELPVHLENQFYNTAVNRLYYACFYGARALTLSKDLAPKTHTGILKVIHSRFVLNGDIDGKYSKLLAKLLQLRTKADYDGSFNATGKEVEQLLEDGIGFITFTEQFLSEFIL